MDFKSGTDMHLKLHDCDICPRECHADRFTSQLGYCRSDASFTISSICIHKGEEPVISGDMGICNIFFTHCNLQCIYCQNFQISDNTTPVSSAVMALEDVILRVSSILDSGINRVGFVSPSHFVPQMKIIIHTVESLGYKPVWVYNSNGYDKPETLRSLEGLIDVYLPDFKYMEAGLAGEYSDARDYPENASLALKEMFRQKGSVVHLDENNNALSGMIIRHLVLPGQIENSMKVLNFIAEELSPKLHISLMSQYFPTPKVSCHPLLKNTVTPEEYAVVVSRMEELDLHNGWVQELDSSSHYRPDFEQEQPFEE
jgi:putative pyruvate formate lyase activating enzyme